jgi:hypothetical protein
MAADRVSLSEGYEGALQQHRGVADEGESVNGLSKKQHAHTNELLSQNKGALASQAGNGSTASANSLSAGALMNTANASGGADYVRRTAGHEDSAAHTQAGDSRTVENAASDLAGRINHQA